MKAVPKKIRSSPQMAPDVDLSPPWKKMLSSSAKLMV